MSADNQPQGFLNRSSVVLALVFSIPAVLTLIGTYYVASTGRVPGGTDIVACQQAISTDVTVTIDVYQYVAGLVEFETQTFSVINETGTQQLFSDTIPVPEPLNCETSILELSQDHYVLQSQKSVAWSTDAGQTWSVQNVCDDPRPNGGRCDAETLNIAEAVFNADGTGSLLVQETIVDEFGEPQRDENDQPVIADEWQVVTSDSGQSWSLADAD